MIEKFKKIEKKLKEIKKIIDNRIRHSFFSEIQTSWDLEIFSSRGKK